MTLRILVVGAGAVGGAYGAMLARAGHAVTFVARGEHGRVIADSGLAVETPEERFVVVARTVADVRDASGLGADLAIVAVKAKDLGAVVGGIAAALGPEGVAVPLLNGLDSEEELRAALGPSRVVGGVAQIAARLVRPGVVRVDAPARMVLAPLPGEPFAPVERFARELAPAGFGCDAKPDLARILWTKLLWNAPFNALCAITRKTAGKVLAVPALEACVRAAMAEVAAVAAHEGVTIDQQMIDRTVDATRTRFAASAPSMLQDVLAGRPTETDALQGCVVVRGARHGVPTPVHRTLHALMLGIAPSA